LCSRLPDGGKRDRYVMSPIKITVKKEGDTYVAFFNICGGGTDGKTIKELMKNCAEVIELTKEVLEDEYKKEDRKSKKI
jgi:predicted RNase H-like HicB family nuclease